MRFSILATISAYAAVTVAQGTPQADTSKPPNPALNVINPAKNAQIPIGSTFQITWTGSTPGTVSLVLLSGCPSNCVSNSTIAGGIANTGSFAWPVSNSYAPDPSTYGIILIDDTNHASYQYSGNFGLTGTGSPAGVSGGASGATASNNATTTATVIFASSSATGTGNVSIPVLTPSNSMTVPSSLQSTVTAGGPTTVAAATTTSSGSSSSQTANAAVPFANARNVGALAVAGFAAVLAF